ncbi:hypothetical protein CFOL_v3_29776 [Cephalotus follicularis]|uniref:Uncharacterized protein n=1 Tax=Cephalotus follicularis TaxID=3775 RepID=A0A1Q3D1L8_CEPFO|nr:hypothetical protein CFOL_v3_29776 [Cephalotus follicularis]
MAPTTQTHPQTKPPNPKLVCFSFAAYAKNVIDHLRSLNIPILPGLTDQEFASIESTFHFVFPPDLRSILREGLPVGPHFPNWRSSSPQQLHILLNLPIRSLFKNISQNNFWSSSWGPKIQNSNDSLSLVKKLLKQAPTLVPIYRNCYISTTPNLAGNPVFYVDDKEVRVLSFDVSGFFQKIDQLLQVGVFFNPLLSTSDHHDSNINVPAWAATVARRIEFWTEVADSGRRVVVAGGVTRWWWSGMRFGLGGCMEEVFWRLKDGGWREEEVREMMMMDGCDEANRGVKLVEHREDVVWHVKDLSLALLRAGWTTEDVVYSLGIEDDHDSCSNLPQQENSFLGFQHLNGCFKEDDHHQTRSTKHLMHVQSLEV